MRDAFYDKAGNAIAMGVIAGLGLLALTAKGLDIANNWITRKKVEKL